MTGKEWVMYFVEEIENYEPVNEQEEVDQAIILQYAKDHPDTILLRENRVAHITSSAVILNKERSKMLMIHHNIYNTWTWVGGHADGEGDMLKLALKEAREETGLTEFLVLDGIAAVDILLVQGHIKKEKYVAPHLHLNVAYVLIADEEHPLELNEDETTGLKWVPVDDIAGHSGEEAIIYVYYKMLKKAGVFIENI